MTTAIKKPFWRGFWRFIDELSLDRVHQYNKKTEFPTVSLDTITVEQAIKSDWEKIGLDMQKVISREQQKIVKNNHKATPVTQK